MSENPYSNLDARRVQDLADRMHESERYEQVFEIRAEDIATLRAAAQHLQSMDEKLSRRIEGDFAQGALFEKRDATRLRSNLAPHGREILNDDGERVIAALAEGEKKVRKIPFGLRATPKPVVVEIDPRKSAPARTGFKLGDL